MGPECIFTLSPSSFTNDPCTLRHTDLPRKVPPSWYPYLSTFVGHPILSIVWPNYGVWFWKFESTNSPVLCLVLFMLLFFSTSYLFCPTTAPVISRKPLERYLKLSGCGSSPITVAVLINAARVLCISDSEKIILSILPNSYVVITSNDNRVKCYLCFLPFWTDHYKTLSYLTSVGTSERSSGHNRAAGQFSLVHYITFCRLAIGSIVINFT